MVMRMRRLGRRAVRQAAESKKENVQSVIPYDFGVWHGTGVLIGKRTCDDLS